jgi:hypothetical protein
MTAKDGQPLILQSVPDHAICRRAQSEEEVVVDVDLAGDSVDEDFAPSAAAGFEVGSATAPVFVSAELDAPAFGAWSSDAPEPGFDA